MLSLPRVAQLFVVLVYAAGVAAAAAAYVMPWPPVEGARWELAAFIAIVVVSGSKKVRLMRHESAADSGSMSVGFALTFAAMLRFGPAAAVMVASMSTFVGGVYPKPIPWFQILFNVALSVIEAWVSGLIFLALNGGTLDLDPLRSFPAVMLSTASFFLINTGAVAIVISLCSGQKPIRLWRETFLWTGPSYVAGACVSTLAILIFKEHMGALLLFASPVAYLMHQLYAVYTARAEEKQQHIEDLQVSQAKLADLYLATIKSLALAIDAKDQYTHQHILRVQRYAVATAMRWASRARSGGRQHRRLLHDIGKLGVPEYVLLKPGRLTAEEFDKIKKHPEIGAAILDPVEFPWPVLPAVKYHHEKWDGTGYPEGLKGEDIPLPGAILAVADVYDALTSSRSYRSAWSPRQGDRRDPPLVGVHFDPAVVERSCRSSPRSSRTWPERATAPDARIRGAPRRRPPQGGPGGPRHPARLVGAVGALRGGADPFVEPGPAGTLDILARKLEAILPGHRVLFLLRDETRRARRARRGRGEPRVLRRLPDAERQQRFAPQSPGARTYQGALRPGRPAVVTNLQTSAWQTIASALIVPIVHQGEVLGTINLYHPQPNAFGPHDRQLLEMIAERAALALYNGLLFDRTRSRALTDPLTGLYNVRYLTEHVEERCQKTVRVVSGDGAGGGPETPDVTVRAADRFALLCLDLDSFKPINDNFGHQKGDEVLCDLAALFRAAVREDDVVARYGGDEFLIVLSGATQEEAQAMAQRLHETVENYDPGLNHPKLGALHLGVSVGFACYPADGQDCATLLSAADAQMYHDKTERKLGRLGRRRRRRAGAPPRGGLGARAPRRRRSR
jgi:diguanylate cyclase (GGDEF)-like protein